MQGARASSGWGKGARIAWRETSLEKRWWCSGTSAYNHTFSVCGKLVGYFPIYSWLRVVVAAIKQRATSVSSWWDDEERDTTLRSMLTETVARVTRDDPVRGDWYVDGNEFTIWFNASSLAMRVTLEANSAIIEDACWLQLENDARHKNLAELDATLKGVNLALQWQARVLHIVTDSVYMHQWITDAWTGKTQLKWNTDMDAPHHACQNHQGIQLSCRCSTDQISHE